MKQGDSSDQHFKFKNNRESMEKNLQFMRESLRKDQRSHKSDTMRLMKENVQLLEQINILKKEEHNCRNQLEELKIKINFAKRVLGGRHRATDATEPMGMKEDL